MNIVVCVKLTPDASDIEIRNDGSISLERAEWIIGGFDLQALEAGIRLAEATSGKVTALSAGPRKIDNSKLKKDILSRGPDALVLVADDMLADADTAVTATVLTQTIRKLSESEPVDLVLFGEGSADLYFQQVGLQVGEMLGWPALNAISKIEPVGQDGRLQVERDLEDAIEVLDIALPAALSVTTDIAQPRLPTMKMILAAAKKTVSGWALVDLGLAEPPQNNLKTLSIRAPRRVSRKNVLISGTPKEEAQQLIHYLNQEGIL